MAMLTLKQLGVGVTVASSIALSGCAHQAPKYPLSAFQSANRVVTRTHVVRPPNAVIDANYNYQQNPAILRAYRQFARTGKANPVSTQGFIAYPYGMGEQPIIACQPLRACDIELEPGEYIRKNGISMGDTSRWVYTTMVSGSGASSVEHLVFKPKAFNISTNVIIATNKRTYYFGLVSKKNSYVRQVKFWYPLQAESRLNQYAQERASKPSKSQVVASVPNLTLNNLHFSYRVYGDSPYWKPIRVFDDGTHTYIQFPSGVRSRNLPVLYIDVGGQKQMVNYRYKAPYYVVDNIFQQAVLILGVGSKQQRVFIQNERDC